MPQPLPCPGAGSPAAYLRVYEPLAAFPTRDREMWAEYASRAASRSSRLVAEHRMALAGVLRTPPEPVPRDEVPEAFVLQVDESTFVCPVQTRLRSWVAFGQFRDGLPEALLHAFVPPASLARVESDRERWVSDVPPAALRILTASWSVPVQWFVPFTPADRVSDLSAEPPSVVHRARMSAARRRAARALRTLRESLGDIDLADEVADLGRWLEEWHPRSWVELDYAGLSRLAGEEDGADGSVADVAAALAALSTGDDEAAAARYRSVIERWTAVAAFEHAN